MMDFLSTSTSVHTGSLLPLTPPKQQWLPSGGRRLSRVRTSAPAPRLSKTLNTKYPVFGDASNKLNCRSENHFNNHPHQGRENSVPRNPTAGRSVVHSARTTSWDDSTAFGSLGGLSSCVNDTCQDTTPENISCSGPQLVTSSVRQAPLHALLTAPTKFKPHSSLKGNGSARFASKSRLSHGSPATPKRARGPPDGPVARPAPSPCTPTTNLKMLTKVASLDEVRLQKISKKALFDQDGTSSLTVIEQNSLGKRLLPSSSNSEYNRESCASKYSETGIKLDTVPRAEASSQSPNVVVTTSLTHTSIRGQSSEIVSPEHIKSPEECKKVSAPVSSTPSTTVSLMRPFSSYCSSLDPDDDVPLISPAPLVEEAYANTAFSNHTHFHFNPNLQSSNASDSEQSLSSGIVCSGQQSSECSLSRSNSSTSGITSVSGRGNDSLGVADYSTVVLHKLPSEISSRRDKSLGLLGERFLEAFPLSVSGLESPRRLVLDEVAAQLSTERRRIYDIVNVLESLNMANKVGKNVYQWSGSQHLLDTLARLKALGDSLGLPKLMAALLDHGTAFKFPAVSAAVGSGSAVETRREKSLGIICQKLLMLLLAAPQPKIISMEAAVQVIVCGDSDLSPTATSKPSGTGTLRRTGSSASLGVMSRTVSENRTVPLPRLPSKGDHRSSLSLCRSNSAWSDAGDSGCAADSSYLQSPCVGDSVEGGRAGKACGAGQQQRARGRRMYDIANVLSALGLVARLPASRSLQYVGPFDLPTLDLQQDEDLFSSCQRQSLLRCRYPSGGAAQAKQENGGDPDVATVRHPDPVKGTSTAHSSNSTQRVQHPSTDYNQINPQDNVPASKPPCVQYSPLLNYSSIRDPVLCKGNNVESRSSLPCSAQCSPVAVVSSTGAPPTASGGGHVVRAGTACLGRNISDTSLTRTDCLGRNSSDTSLTRTLGKKTSSLLEVAELELQRLLAEEREAKERQERLKRLQYLVSPGYCQELQARLSIPAPRAEPAVIKVSDGTFAVPTGTAPRSPLIMARDMPVVLVRGAAPSHQPTAPHGTAVQQRTLHTGQHRAQNIILVKKPPQHAPHRPAKSLAGGTGQQQQQPSRPSSLTYVKPVQRSPLFNTIDRARIITLNKNHSFRILPQLKSPRIALSFPEAPTNSTSDTGVGSSINEGPLQPINLSLKGTSEAQCQLRPSTEPSSSSAM